MAEDGYGGLLSAFPYAYRRSRSRAFRAYVAAAGLVGLLAAVIVALGVVTLLASTGTTEGTDAFVRGFYVVVGAAAFAPLVAPVLLVARRHRRRGDSPARYDATIALAGFLFLLSLYAGLVASTPPARQETLEPFVLALGGLRLEVGVTAAVGRALYDLPRSAGLVLPTVGALVVALAHLLAR